MHLKIDFFDWYLIDFFLLLKHTHFSKNGAEKSAVLF